MLHDAPPTLRDLRKRKKLSQEGLGRLAGCSGELVSAIELGKVRDTKGRVLNGFARALGVSRDVVEAAIERSVVTA